MRPQENDLTFHRLERLAVLAPDAARGERIRARCHAVIAERQQQHGEKMTAGRFTGIVVGSMLTFGFSVGLLFAMIDDVLRVYLRR